MCFSHCGRCAGRAENNTQDAGPIRSARSLHRERYPQVSVNRHTTLDFAHINLHWPERSRSARPTAAYRGSVAHFCQLVRRSRKLSWRHFRPRCCIQRDRREKMDDETRRYCVRTVPFGLKSFFLSYPESRRFLTYWSRDAAEKWIASSDLRARMMPWRGSGKNLRRGC